MGIIDEPVVLFDCDALNVLTEMYQDHGHTLAMQYGGSNLVNDLKSYRKIIEWTSHSRELIQLMKRYWRNQFNDTEKQAAMNLFLGKYVPRRDGHSVPLWDLLSDYYLHRTHPRLQYFAGSGGGGRVRRARRSYIHWRTPMGQRTRREASQNKGKMGRYKGAKGGGNNDTGGGGGGGGTGDGRRTKDLRLGGGDKTFPLVIQPPQTPPASGASSQSSASSYFGSTSLSGGSTGKRIHLSGNSTLTPSIGRPFPSAPSPSSSLLLHSNTEPPHSHDSRSRRDSGSSVPSGELAEGEEGEGGELWRAYYQPTELTSLEYTFPYRMMSSRK